MNKTKLENALFFVDAVLDGYSVKFGRVENREKINFYLYVENPFYNPKYPGESPALVIDFEDLKYLLENVIIIAE